jgi:hypothetical protein
MANSLVERREVFKDVGQYFQYEKGFVHMDAEGIKERFGREVPAFQTAGDAFKIYNDLTSEVLGTRFDMKNPKGYMPLKKSAYQVLEDAYVEAYRRNLDSYEMGKTLTRDERVATYFMLKKSLERIPEDIKTNVKDCVSKHDELHGTTKTLLKEVNGEGLETLAENVANATMAIIDMESKKRRIAHRYGADGRRERLKKLFGQRDEALATFLGKAIEPYQVSERAVFAREEAVDISAVMSDLRAMMGITSEDVSNLVNSSVQKDEELIPGVTCLYEGQTPVGFKYQDVMIAFKDNTGVKALVAEDGAVMIYKDKDTGVRLKNVEGPMRIELGNDGVRTGKVDLSNVKADGDVTIKASKDTTVVSDSTLSGKTVIEDSVVADSSLVDSEVKAHSKVSASTVTHSLVRTGVVDASTLANDGILQSYAYKVSGDKAKLERSALAGMSAEGDYIDALMVSGSTVASKKNFTAALNDLRHTADQTTADQMNFLGIDYLKKTGEDTLSYQLPDQDAINIYLPNLETAVVDKKDKGFTLTTPAGSSVSLSGDLMVTGGDLRVSVGEIDSSVSIDGLTINNYHQDNVIAASDHGTTILKNVEATDYLNLENVFVDKATLSNVTMLESTAKDSQVIDSLVTKSVVTDSLVVSSEVVDCSQVTGEAIYVKAKEEVLDGHRFGKITYDNKADYDAVVADYKASRKTYTTDGTLPGRLTEDKEGCHLDNLVVSSELVSARVDVDGKVDAVFKDGHVLVEKTTATDKVVVDLKDDASVTLSGTRFEGLDNRLSGSVTVVDSTIKEGSTLEGGITVTRSTVDSTSLKDATVHNSQLLGVDQEVGSIVDSTVVNSRLQQSTIEAVKDLSESTVLQSTLKGTGRETVADSQFLESDVTLQTSLHDTGMAWAKTTATETRSYVLGNPDKRLETFRYHDAEAFEKAVTAVSNGQSYDDVRPTYEPMPTPDKEDNSALADYDMSIGSPTVEQEGTPMVSQVDKWFEDAFGPLPKEEETVVETAKLFELSNEADLSGFQVKDLMDKVEDYQAKAVENLDPSQFEIQGASLSQGK